MPKQKTRRSLAKRVSVTSTGKVRRRKAFMNHMLGKKASTRKRRLNTPDGQ
ncbi:MAG TPA: 50S ribosomal protein L35, partial [Actinomycetota bacterium]|nr:50S ribosomal protein L35 [Actinomycetota bacterium]